MLRYNPLTTDATPLSYNSFLLSRTGNISLNSTVIKLENLIGTRNLTQQEIQTSFQFTNSSYHSSNNSKKSNFTTSNTTI